MRIPPSTDPFVVDIPVQLCTEALIRRLKELLARVRREPPGDALPRRRARLAAAAAGRGVRRGRLRRPCCSELRRLLGPGAVREGAPEPARV